LVNLQVFQPPPPPKLRTKDFVEQPLNNLDASLFLPTYTSNPFFPPQYGLLNAAIQPQAPIVPTIIKNYTINAAAPVAQHEKLSYIYEDMLPTINIPGKITTLDERNKLQSYLRSILFSYGDGEDINLDDRANSLMQYLKYMDLNPFNSHELEQNPYKSLPDNFLIYRTCYPIKKEGNQTKCAKNSIGLNIRIYGLTSGEYNVHKPLVDLSGNITAPTSKYMDFDAWRELKYYEYVRDYILKKNICPNFVNFIGYYVNEKSQINFNEVNIIKKNGKAPVKPPTITVPPVGIPPTVNDPQKLYDYFIKTYGVNIGLLNPTMSFGHALIALTEAPLYNLLGFASTVYQRDGAVKRMISTGFYNENIWYSLLFQIMVALYVLQENEILFNNFSIEHNIFIKDLSLHSNLTGFWKYKIKGIDYYIPNYGYLALLDSNYSDISGNKISSTHFGDPSGNIKDLIFDNMFVKAFDSQVFSNPTFSAHGGIKPPSSIIQFLDSIKNDATSSPANKNILHYIEKYMKNFLNNRIGTYLKELEVPNIRRDAPNYRKGQIVVHEISVDTFVFALYLEPDTKTMGNSKILIKDSTNNIVEKSVNDSLLHSYNKAEVIEQSFKPNEINLNEDDLIETYIVSV